MVLNNSVEFKKYFFGCLLYSELLNFSEKNMISKEFLAAFYSILSVCVAKYYREYLEEATLKSLAKTALNEVVSEWYGFENYICDQFHNSQYFSYQYNFFSKVYKMNGHFSKYYRSSNLPIDINDYFFSGEIVMVEQEDSRRKLMKIEKYLKSINLSLEMLKEIIPLINLKNWFDPTSIDEISNQLNFDRKTVVRGIKFITSKEFGYYVMDLSPNADESALALPGSDPQ